MTEVSKDVVAEAAAVGHEDFCEEHQGAFDLTILLPKANFASNDGSKTGKSEFDPKDLASYVYIFLPASGQDAIRDIKQTVSESLEGSWLGSHSFQRVLLKEEPAEKEGEEPKMSIDEIGEEVYQENVDLAHVFSAPQYSRYEVRRCLRVVQTSYTEADARAHVLRLREAASHANDAAQLKNYYHTALYDPSSLVLDAGVSLFTSIRGAPTEESEAAQLNGTEGQADVNGENQEPEKPRTSSSKHKKGKGRARFAGKPLQSLPAIIKKAQPESLSSKWLSEPEDPLAIHLKRKDLRSTVPASTFYKNLQVSVWNPPPHHLRLKGHHLYLTATTLEGETFHITSSQDGFYVNRSDNHHFDPSPRSAQSKSSNQTTASVHSSLFSLLAAASPQFALRIQKYLTEAQAASPDFFATVPITNCLPAAPWLAEIPDVTADSSRSQAAYLLTGATNAESLPAARDWNEELTSMRELPRSTNEEKLVRDRFASRFQADFQAAAARGAASIGRGEVQSLNAMDATEAKSYLVNNILYTLAQDSVDAFSHLGGDEAARVTAGKDLYAVKLLNDADIPGVHSIATAVVDYCGERWVAQAIPPGIFNRAAEQTGDEKAEEKDQSTQSTEEGKEADKKDASVLGPSLKAVYGPANTDKPNEGYVADPTFGLLAEKIAKQFHLAKHTVTDVKGRETELWTPADTHGVIASDGRAYVIDLFRLFPVDVNFLEQNIEGKIYDNAEGTEASTEDKYPHRATLLRPELIELYHATKTREWIEQQVKEKSAADATVASKAAIKDTVEGDDKTSDKPESATSEDFVKVDGAPEQTEAEEKTEEAESKEQTIIDVGDFKLAFNPDAFVDRPDQPLHTAALAKEEEDESTKAVRDASTFLRDAVIPSLIREAITDEIIPLDSTHLSQILHKKGINVRYLGYIAELSKKTPEVVKGQTLPESAEEEIAAFLAKFRASLIRDMIVRASKHVLRKYIAGLRTGELTQAIAHFLNCLVGYTQSLAPESQASWASLTAASLRSELVANIRQRFRYALPAEDIEKFAPKPQLLREICLASGIQLALQPYTFDAPASSVNGSHSDDADKKKSSGKSAPPAKVERKSTFVPDDIVNVYAVAKKAYFRSAMTEDLFEQGQMFYLRGNNEHGEAFVGDALNFYEQIFGAVHPEMAEAYRTLANLYHRISQPLARRIQLYEAAATFPASREEDIARLKAESGIADDEAAQQARMQHEIFLQQAVKITRQAVIIAERTAGVDSQEALQCYSDLAIFEHSIGNIDLAMKLLQHSVALSNTLYGENHPEKAKAAYFAASMLKSSRPQSQAQAIPYYKAAQELASKAYGPNSIICANSAYQLAQCLIVDGQLSESIPHISEALRIFESRQGKESESAREASQLLVAVKQAIEQRERGELEKVQKMAKRIGGDPARAKELMNRMQGSSSANGKKAVSDSKVEGTKIDDKTGSRGHLDVDELVQFIQGGDKKSAGKAGKGGKKSNGSKK